MIQPQEGRSITGAVLFLCAPALVVMIFSVLPAAFLSTSDSCFGIVGLEMTAVSKR